MQWPLLYKGMPGGKSRGHHCIRASLSGRFVDCITCLLARGSFPNDVFLLWNVESSFDVEENAMLVLSSISNVSLK